MPQLKPKIVSFTTEDPNHVADNILCSDTQQKWKCKISGEKSACIILQLENATAISSIHVGNEHSAYIEVLVNRSTTPDDFKVLLVMSSFMSPLESRNGTNVNKVRMFNYNEFQSPERDQKWDRIKVICTQPFNRHVQYGLSFITLYSKEGPEAMNETPLKLGNFLLRPKSPENLSVGSLFARRKDVADRSPITAAAAIRNATASPKMQQPVPKLPETILKRRTLDSNSKGSDCKTRMRDELVYSRDETLPNDKIDKLIKNKTNEVKRTKELQEKDITKNAEKIANTTSDDKTERKVNSKEVPIKRKMERQERPFNELLKGITIVISGIQNPERESIRSEALAMGAKYKGDWSTNCTHLICAFMNTPKYKQVKGKGKIVNRLWIADCHSQRKRLPWRSYALDPSEKVKPLSEDEIWEEECVSTKEKKIMNSGQDETKLNIIEEFELSNNYDSYTDEDDIQVHSENRLPNLPDILSNKVFYIDVNLKERTRSLLVRYITALNGILVDDASDVVDFAISCKKSAAFLRGQCPDAHIIAPDWIWECHNKTQLVSFHEFEL